MTKNAEDLVMKMINCDLVNLESFMEFMFKPTSFMEEKTKSSWIHLMPRFKIAQTVIRNLSRLESSGRIKNNTFPLTHLQNRIVESTGANSKELRELLKELIHDMYSVFGYKRIEEFIQRLDLKFLEQVSDPYKTPEIQAYLKVAEGA
jgi:hypothetical protein